MREIHRESESWKSADRDPEAFHTSWQNFRCSRRLRPTRQGTLALFAVAIFTALRGAVVLLSAGSYHSRVDKALRGGRVAIFQGRQGGTHQCRAMALLHQNLGVPPRNSPGPPRR